MTELVDAVKYIGRALGEVFRHLLPGLLALGAVATSRPSWFEKVELLKEEWLIVLGVLAIVIGNVWFVVHRYFVQQIVDWLFWLCNAEGGPKRSEKYATGVADQVWKFFSAPNVPEDIRQHIRFRTSSVVLMYITAEVTVVAVLLAEQNSKLALQKWWLLFGAIALFAAAVWQNYITRRIEGKIVSWET